MLNESQKFDILLESYKDTHETYMKNFWAAISSALLFMGWLLSSESAQELFRTQLHARRAVFAAAGVCIMGHIFISSKFFLLSRKKAEKLTEHLDVTYHNNYAINPSRYILNMAIVILIVCLDTFLLWKV